MSFKTSLKIYGCQMVLFDDAETVLRLNEKNFNKRGDLVCLFFSGSTDWQMIGSALFAW